MQLVGRCRRLAAMLGLCLGVCMLSACYTNYNQRLLEDYREYTGYDINYDKSEESRSLEPVLYRAKNAWYLAGVKCPVEAIHSMPPWHSAFSSWYDRNETSPVRRAGQPIYYHKITPEMANRLRSTRPMKAKITDGMIAASMKKAGGGWVRRLPQGARAVPAAQLRMAASAPHWVMVDSVSTRAPWYMTAAAGATFVCYDVPYSAICSVACAVACTVASPVLVYTMVAAR